MKQKRRRVRNVTPRDLSYEEARRILIDVDDEYAETLKRDTIASSPRQFSLFGKLFGRRKNE